MNDRVADNFCTFQVLSSNFTEVAINQGPRLHFKDNIADFAGSSVYASPIFECQQSNLVKLNNMSHLYDIIFQFEDHHDYQLFSKPIFHSCQDCAMPC